MRVEYKKKTVIRMVFISFYIVTEFKSKQLRRNITKKLENLYHSIYAQIC